MYTLIICSEAVINDCNKTYDAFISPLADKQHWDFCRWNPEGVTLQEACPQLEHLISRHKEWRAIIINDASVSDYEHISKKNPFDISGSVADPVKFESAAEIEEYRKSKETAHRKALDNPLMKLATWLLGGAVSGKPFPVEGADVLPSDLSDEYLETAAANRINLAEVEIDRAIERKYEIFHERFEDEPQVFNRPRHLVVIGERSRDDNMPLSATFNASNEFEYSRFYEDNLYPKAVRYILYDVNYVNRMRDREMYFGMLVFAAVMAGNEWPYEALRPERVYIAESVISEEKMTQLCGRYIDKLKKTEKEIERRINVIKNERIGSISNQMVEELFESDESINVRIDSAYDKDKLMADSRGIGFFRDYPEDEMASWNEQFRGIKKLFTRFLRDPQRAVKVAAQRDLREKNTIDDERVLRLDEFQIEGIEYRLLEEEQNMIEVDGMHVFDVERYQKKLDKASSELTKKIMQRMTRNKAVRLSLIALALFFAGLVPFIINGFKYSGKPLLPLAVTGVFTAVLAVCILIVLTVMWFKQKSVYDRFNDVMENIYEEIDEGTGKFSDYLSHVCNVMREFSVLNAADDAAVIKCETMAQHTRDIEERIDEVYRLFFNYINEYADYSDEVVPYDYNYTVLKRYSYEMPYSGDMKEINFLQSGFRIEIPVDYLEAVTMRREELYD